MVQAHQLMSTKAVDHELIKFISGSNNSPWHFYEPNATRITQKISPHMMRRWVNAFQVNKSKRMWCDSRISFAKRISSVGIVWKQQTDTVVFQMSRPQWGLFLRGWGWGNGEWNFLIDETYSSRVSVLTLLLLDGFPYAFIIVFFILISWDGGIRFTVEWIN